MDVVIVGNGLSALLLARALVRRGSCRRIRIVGPVRSPKAKILSYWTEAPTPFDDDALAEWSTVSVVTRDGHELRRPLNALKYRTFRAAAWVERARACLADRVEFIDAYATVEDGVTSARVSWLSETHELDWVFVSGASVATPDAWQQFTGWDLRVTSGAIDARTARLLDFRTTSTSDFRFVYALPYAPGRLFIEHVSHTRCDHDAALSVYLRDVVGVDEWELLAREHGATPLYRDPPDRGEHHVIRIGVAGGLAKASTGYALLRMWRDAELIADSMATNGHPYLHGARPSLYRLADHHFFELLKAEPARIEALLASMFEHVSGDGVLRFLDERATPREQLHVALAVPGWLVRQLHLLTA